MEISGMIAAGESSAALVYAKARRGLSARQAKIILFGGMMAVAVPATKWMSGSWLIALVSVEFAILGLIAASFLIQRLAAPAMRRALAERGQPYEQGLTIRLTPEIIVYDLADLTMSAPWSCVTDLYRTRKYWVFLVQSSAMVLPRRFFAAPEAEREFVAEALSRMTDAARSRSPDAVRTAG